MPALSENLRGSICPHCDRLIKGSSSKIRDHILAKHSGQKPKPKPKNIRLNICDICQAEIRGSRTKLRQHVLGHTGTATATVINGVASRNHRTIVKQQRLSIVTDPSTIDYDVEKAAQMSISYPRAFRRTGGVFTDGPLSLTGVLEEGMPQIFDQQGQVRKAVRFNAVRARAAELKMDWPNLGWLNHPRGRPTRQCSVRACGPIQNRTWSKEATPGCAVIETNMWTPAKYPDWPKPEGWEGDWPDDPTAAFACELQCERCSCRFCTCIHDCNPEPMPEIVDAGEMGEGVRSRRPYANGEFLGELVRELAPLGFYHDGWAAELVRPDMADYEQVSVCLVYPRECGNWARKINHSCDFNAVFEATLLSGRWRVMVKATTYIAAGAAINVDYGEEYWEGYEKDCLCGSQNCISKKNKY